MFIAPKISLVHCFVRRSGQTFVSVYDGVSAPPNEAGSGEGLRAINILPLRGKEVLRIFGALSSRSHKDARGNTPDLFKLICGHLQYHSYVAHVCTCRTGDDRVTESLKETKRIASLQK